MGLKNDANYTTWNIAGYIETGDPTYITRFNNSRNSVCNTTFRDEIRKILRKKNMSAQDYVTTFYNRMFTLEDALLDLLREFIAYGDYKYGREDTKEYLSGYITSGNPAYITRDSGLRNRFKEMNVAERVRLYMRATGETIDQVIERAIPRRKYSYFCNSFLKIY
jgi:uncharacterized protein (UPF0297 family)